MGRSTEVVNCRLLRVQAEGIGDTYESTGDTYDDPPADPEDAPGADKFLDDVGAFYEEKTSKRIRESGTGVVVWRTLLVGPDLGIDWELGDVVTIRLDDQADDTVVVVEGAETGNVAKGEDSGEVILTLKAEQPE